MFELIPEYQKKWRNQSLNCSNIDHLSVELNLKTIYRAIGLSEPEIEFFDSPRSAAERFNLDYWGNEIVKIDELLERHLREELSQNLWKQLRREIYEPLHDRLWLGIGRRIFDCLEDNRSTWHDLNSTSGENNEYFNPVMDFMTTEYLTARGCWFDFAYSTLNCQSVPELWQSYRSLITNCGWLLAYKDVCVVCSRPSELRVDEQFRLHGIGTPAILFADGFSVYAYQGVILPERYARIHPSYWKIHWILEEHNAELRRILINGIGYDRICQASFSEELDSWQEYTLLRININDDHKPAYLLKMTCPSTEKIHALRVPPEMRSARKAIRWINWGIDPSEFTIQT